MQQIKVTKQEKSALAIATAIAIVFGAYFLSTFFILIVLAGILAFLFNPLYQKLCKKMSPSSASALVLIISILMVVGPLILIIFFAAAQISNNISSLANTFTGSGLTEMGDNFIAFVNNFTKESVQNFHKIMSIINEQNQMVEELNKTVMKFNL